MAIDQDVYLFDPLAFVSDMEQGTRLLLKDRQTGWEKLHAAALNAFDTHEHVQWLVGNYGGGDRAHVVSELKEEDAIEYGYLLLLYKHLSKPQGPSMKTIGAWNIAKTVLQPPRWNDGDIALVAKGRNFRDLILTTSTFSDLAPEQLREVCDWWSRIAPRSHCGHAGWLGREDVQRLYKQMPHTSATSDPSDGPIANLRKMLSTAADRETGLCLIISG